MPISINDSNFMHKCINEPMISVKRKNGLLLCDYTPECSQTFNWNEYTLCCRGIIFEENTGKIIGHGFDKFMNYSELCDDQSGTLTDRAKLLPKEYQPNISGSFEALDKIDGSCIITYWYKNDWHTNTRGSFDSDQAHWAYKWLHENININNMNKNYTYIFECVYPDNKIVVDYGNMESLILIGVRDLSTNELFYYEKLNGEAKKLGCNIPKIYTFDSFYDVLKTQSTLSIEREGHVIRFYNGYMCKIKGDEYCMVHSLISNVTPLAYWRMYNIETDSINIDMEHFKNIPEEIEKFSIFLINTTKEQHISRYEKIKNTYDQIPNTLTGRDKYEWMKANINADDFKPVMSLVKNNILYAKKIIHQQLRPTGNKYKDVDLPKRFSHIISETD